MIVGWAMAEYMRAALVIDALKMALHRRRPDQGLIHTAMPDRNTSLAFGQQARDAGIAVSMGSKGEAFDNAVAESFFATIKKELVHRESWHTRRDLGSAVFEYIEAFYNRQRRHSTLGYLSQRSSSRRTSQPELNLAPKAENCSRKHVHSNQALSDALTLIDATTVPYLTAAPFERRLINLAIYTMLLVYSLEEVKAKPTTLYAQLVPRARQARPNPPNAPAGSKTPGNRTQKTATPTSRGHGSHFKQMAERAGFEPAMEFDPHTRLAGECLQPLGHLSWCGQPF